MASAERVVRFLVSRVLERIICAATHGNLVTPFDMHDTAQTLSPTYSRWTSRLRLGAPSAPSARPPSPNTSIKP
jgi:hypothetical protein